MGCKEAFPLAKKSAHERDCPFLQLKCPFHGQCAFNGALADVVPHLAAEHQVPNLGGKLVAGVAKSTEFHNVEFVTSISFVKSCWYLTQFSLF